MDDPYTALPLDPDAKLWLDGVGVELPAGLSWGHWPTADQLRELLEGQTGWTVRITQRPDTQAWDAIVDCAGSPVTLWVEPGRTAVDSCRFSLHDTDAVAVATFVEALTRTQGPWVLYDVSSGKPALVLPGSDPREIADRL